MTDSNLAIVIPAYKAMFLDECLRSICSQTNKDFTVYIGNDGSPDDIDSIVDKYSTQENIRYFKFEDNLGSHSLVKHWERCVNMIGKEKWVWLFSDDDIMAPDCVAGFFKTRGKYPNSSVFRFNLDVTDQDGKTFRSTVYPKLESAEDFFLKRMALQYDSSISNYIFSAKELMTEGFVKLPLAWCSDDATIIRIAKESPIVSCEASGISWRISGQNISSKADLEYVQKKTIAKVEFIKWVYKFSDFKTLWHRKTKLLVLNWIIGPIKNPLNKFDSETRRKLSKEIERELNVNIELFLFKKKMHYKFKNWLSKL